MTTFLSLGSNQGDRKFNLDQAIALLQKTSGVTVVKISSIYETEPWGGVEQKPFLNLVLELDTKLTPWELLRECKEIEDKLGRKKEIHWGPRVIDLDILSYQDFEIQSEELTIPHPYMEQREFVLAPLREIVPGFLLPSGKIAKNVKGEGKVKKISF